MREIDKNDINFRTVDTRMDVPQPSEQVPAPETVVAQQGTENLSLAPEAVIGRSQVQMSGASRTDNLEADMKTMIDNPNSVKKAVDFFDIAYNQLKETGSDQAYEKAAELTNAFKEDFLK